MKIAELNELYKHHFTSRLCTILDEIAIQYEDHSYESYHHDLIKRVLILLCGFEDSLVEQAKVKNHLPYRPILNFDGVNLEIDFLKD